MKKAAEGLDVVASRRGSSLFLHVVNTDRTRAVTARLQIAGVRVQGGRVLEIVDAPMVEVTLLNSDQVMRVSEKGMTDTTSWDFPAASVSVVELTLGEGEAAG